MEGQSRLADSPPSRSQPRQRRPARPGRVFRDAKRDEYKRAREWDRKVKKRSADTKAFLAQHDGADGKQGTFDLDDLIERCRKRVISYIRKGERFTWARLCAIRATFPDLKPSDRNAEQRHDEAIVGSTAWKTSRP